MRGDIQRLLHDLFLIDEACLPTPNGRRRFAANPPPGEAVPTLHQFCPDRPMRRRASDGTPTLAASTRLRTATRFPLRAAYFAAPMLCPNCHAPAHCWDYVPMRPGNV